MLDCILRRWSWRIKCSNSLSSTSAIPMHWSWQNWGDEEDEREGGLQPKGIPVLHRCCLLAWQSWRIEIRIQVFHVGNHSTSLFFRPMLPVMGAYPMKNWRQLFRPAKMSTKKWAKQPFYWKIHRWCRGKRRQEPGVEAWLKALELEIHDAWRWPSGGCCATQQVPVRTGSG